MPPFTVVASMGDRWFTHERSAHVTQYVHVSSPVTAVAVRLSSHLVERLHGRAGKTVDLSRNDVRALFSGLLTLELCDVLFPRPLESSPGPGPQALELFCKRFDLRKLLGPNFRNRIMRPS